MTLRLLAPLTDMVGARTAHDVESTTLTAVRAVFDADAAFWLDAHDGGDLRMSALAGFARPEAHALSVVPAGTGISATIITTDSPVAVADYLAHPRAIEPFATLFRREGIESVAGAPMRSPEGVCGALFVLCRRRRDFGDDELNLLVWLAGLARALRITVQERERAEGEAHRQRLRAEADDRFRQAVDRLTAALIRGSALVSGLAAASDELGVRLHVEGLPEDGLPSPTGLTGDAVPAAGRTHARIPGADLAILAAEGRLPDGQLESLSALISLDFHRRRAQVETELRLTDDFVHRLLTGGTAELDRLWKQASLVGMNLTVPRVAISIGLDGPVDRNLLDRIDREMRSRTIGGQATTYDGDVILLWPTPTTDDQNRLPTEIGAVLTACRPRRLTAGIGPVCRGAEDYPAAVREAIFARRVAADSTVGKTIVSTADLGMYRLFAHVGGVDALRTAAYEALGPLHELDARDGSDLVATLRAFLERDRRVAETARALHVHVNTLRYRIERITRVLTLDLDDPEAKFFLLLALRLASVVAPTKSGSQP